MRSLGSVLNIRKEKVDRKTRKFSELQPITIHFDGTIDKREVDENREYSMELFHARAGDIVVSKIDLKNGAVSIIPADWHNSVVTGHFAVYEPDLSKVVPEYLRLIIQTRFFKTHLWRNKVGAEGRKEVKLDFFEAQPIPLPPLATQQKIVAAWEASRRAAADTAAKIAHLEADIEKQFLADLGLEAPAQSTSPKCFMMQWKDIARWSVSFNALASTATNLSGGKYGAAMLGDVAKVSYGIQKSPTNRPGQHARPYLRVANVQRGELDLREIKYIEVADTEMTNLRLEPGDLVVCEGNSADLVGRPAMWRGEILDCVHQNHILKVRVDSEKAIPEYVLEYMHSAPARNHLRARAKFTTNLASINSNDLRELPLALPPLPIQRQIVERITKQRDEIARLKSNAGTRLETAKADVEAMILGTRPA
jgi:type I restriction enzyme S subunit